MNHLFRPTALTLSLCGLLAHSMPAFAQSSTVEGELREIVLTSGTVEAPTALRIECNGVKFTLSAATRITSPTANMTLASLNSEVEFPGAPYLQGSTEVRKGFRGGTCIVTGGLTPNADGSMPADEVFVEMAENVLVGPRFANGTIMGVSIWALTDSRMPAAKKSAGLFTSNTGAHPGSTEVIRNEFGFGVQASTIPAGDLMSASGYRGRDGNMYAHTIESSGGVLIDQTVRPSIQRAQCQNLPGIAKDSLEVRGGCVLPAGTISSTIKLIGITATGATQDYGSVVCAQAVPAGGGNPGMGAYRFAGSRMTFTGDACPTKIAARQMLFGVVLRGIDVVTPDER